MTAKTLAIVLGGALMVSWVTLTLVSAAKDDTHRSDAPAAWAEPDMTEDAADVDALRRELALLGAQVAGLQQQLKERETVTPSQAHTQAQEETDQLRDHDASTPAQRNESARQVMLARMNAIDERHLNEVVDDNWASLAETRIVEGLQGNNSTQVSLQNVDCRSTVCKLALNAPAQSDLAELRMDLAMGLSDVISQGAMRIVGQDAGSRQVVFYLTRKGHALPGLQAHEGTDANR